MHSKHVLSNEAQPNRSAEGLTSLDYQRGPATTPSSDSPPSVSLNHGIQYESTFAPCPRGQMQTGLDVIRLYVESELEMIPIKPSDSRETFLDDIPLA